MRTSEIINRIESATGFAPRPSGDGWIARCPFHEDRSPSLSVKQGSNGQTLVHCHAGCSAYDITEALGLGVSDLYSATGEPEQVSPPSATSSHRPAPVVGPMRVHGGFNLVERYDYRGADGSLLYHKARFERTTAGEREKTFRCYQPTGAPDEFVLGLSGVNARPLYGLPSVCEAVGRGESVVVVEGEKDADRLRRDTSYVATSTDGGANVWKDEHTAALAGADVVVVADHDEPGEKHAEAVCRALSSVARSVRLLRLGTLPDGSPMPKGGDASDWLDAAAAMPEVDGPAAFSDLLRGAPLYTDPSSDPAAGPSPMTQGEAPEPVAELTSSAQVPTEVYKRLPATIAAACFAYDRPVQRGAFLVSLLAVLSAMLPNVVFRYGRETLSTHLYGFLVGGPASGKGVVKVAVQWARHVDNRLSRESSRERKEWKAKHDERERLRKSRSNKAGSEIRALDATDPLDEEPPQRFLVMGEDTTAAGLADAVHGNPDGVLLSSTEADTVVDANGRQHGGFSPLFRKGFHNESHGESRRGADRLSIAQVRLALLLAGTLDQVRAMFGKGIKDGLYSRFMIAGLEPTRYESQREAAHDSSFDRIMDAGATAASDIYWALRKRQGELRIALSVSQWARMDEAYEEMDADLFSTGRDELTPLAKRGPVVAYRIAAVLAVWRAHEDRVDLSTVESIEVPDDDADAALVLALLASEMAVELATEFGAPSGLARGRAQAIAKEAKAADQHVLDALSAEFEPTDVVDRYKPLGKSRSTAYRRLDAWEQEGLVERIGDGKPHKYRKANASPES